ncbi:MAG: PAS domain-containing protein, partial [Planctomycetota bacterium]
MISFLRTTQFPRTLRWAILALLGVAIACDFFTPLGSVDGVLYVVVVALAALLMRPRPARAVAWISSGVTVISFGVDLHGSSELVYLVLNHSVRLGVIWGAYALAIDYRETIRTLRQGQERFQEITETAPGVFWVIDARDFRLLYISPAYEEIWGRSRETLLANPEEWAEAVHPDDQERTGAAFFNLIKTGSYDEEYRIVQADGTIRWIRDRGAPVTGRSGRIIRLVGIAEDITERKIHQEEAEEYARRLEEANSALAEAKSVAENANRAKSNFLANMSHEIRTPMTAILGYSEVLQEPDLSDYERDNAIQTVRQNGDHLLTLINDILDLSKIEAGMLHVELAGCSPGEVSTAVMKMLAERAKSKNLDFQLLFETEVPETFPCDTIRLRQILINLLGNAIKFTKTGGVDLILRRVEVEGATHLDFAVRDTGIGISEEEIKKLFQPFTQANNSTTREFGGTGLGLTISR